jgi:hypothetical protein
MFNASPDIQTSSKWFSGLNFIKAALYIAYSTVLLFPILSNPLVADDFAAPFYQFDNAGPGAISALKYGFNNAYGGVNFRVLGMPLGSFIHFLYVDLASRFGVQITTSYFITKLVVYLGIGIIGGMVCGELLRLIGKTLSHWTVLYVSSTVIFVTLQNHGMWSNDPVSGYPLAGFGSVILGLSVLAYSLRTVRLGITRSRVVCLTILTTTSVLYYELNVGIIIGVAPLLVIATLRSAPDTSLSFFSKIKKLMFVSIPCVVPALALVFGQIISGSATQNYGGTTIRLGSHAINTFFSGMISTLPGSSWALSKEFLGGSIGFLAGVLPIVGLVVLVVTMFLYSESQQKREMQHSDGWILTASLISLLIFWFVGVGVQSVTTKVQDESPRIGYVYTYYAIGATVVALMISLTILYFGSSLRLKISTVIVGLVLLIIGSCQLTVNWRLMDKMNASLEPNRALLATFSSHSDIPHRCRALIEWTGGGWPSYYEEGMTDGLQAIYLHYHGEKFCPNFVMPMP